MIDLVGQTLLNYRLDAAMRAGHSGQLFRATQTESGRVVALKLFKPGPFQAQMKEELQPLLALKHVNIVETIEIAEAGSQLFLVSEFVPGGSLTTLLSRYTQENKTLELPLGLSLMLQAAEALTFAHGKGIIHGDLKPDNLLLSVPATTTQLSKAYTLKIGDFSVTRISSDSAMTQDELVVSSPAYMSPEQCQGVPSDNRTDLYSFGIVMYEAFTGLLPFEVKNIGEAAIKHLYAAPRSPKELRPDISPELESLILRLLAKNPADRYANTSDVRDALRGMLERIEPQGPPPTLIRGAMAGLPAQPAIPELPDTSDGPRVTIADASGRIVKVLTLTSAGIRVGRLDTNEAKLEDDLVSRQHLRIDWNGEQAYITDLGSSNGTLMANQRLLPQSPTNWAFRSSVGVGSYWLRLESPELASRMMVGLALDASSEKLTLQAGSAGVIRVTVANLGRLVDHFNFTVQGIPEAWVRGPTEAVQLNPGAQTAVMLTVTPPRNASATAGTREINVVATSREHPENTASAKGALTILPFAQTTFTLKPMRRSARTKTTYTATLTNNGNAKLHYALYCEEDEPKLGFKFAEPLPALEPGQTKDVPLEVAANFKLLGGTQIRAFRVIAKSSTRPVAFPGQPIPNATSSAPINAQQLAGDAAQNVQGRLESATKGAGNDALRQVQNAMLGDGELDPSRLIGAAQQNLKTDARAVGRQAMQNAQGGLLEAGKKVMAGPTRAAQLAPIIPEDAVLPGGDPMPLNAQLAHGALLPLWLPPAILALLALLFFIFNRPPTITSFEASTLQPFLKAPLPVRFETSGANKLELQIGADTPVPVDANAKTFNVPGFQTTTPTKLTLIARGNFGTTTQKELTIAPQTRTPVITEFRAIPPQLIRGQPVLLKYSTKDTTQLLLDRGDGQPPTPLKNLQGTLRDTPREPRTYKLIAINGEKRTEVPLTISVNVLPPQVPGFKISPSPVIRGRDLTIRLEWKTRNAAKVELTDVGTVPDNNILDLAAPAATKTYTITATNAKGESVTKSATATVIDPPIVAPPPAAPPPVVPPPLATPPAPPIAIAPPPTTPIALPPAPAPPPPAPTPTPPAPRPPVIPVKPPPPTPPTTNRPPAPPTPPTTNRPPTPPIIANVPPPATPTPPTPPTPPAQAPGGPLTGTWYHNYGTLELTQVGSKVTGTYTNALTGKSGKIDAAQNGIVFKGTDDGLPFSWTLSPDLKTFNGINGNGGRWCGAKAGTAFAEGCSFSGVWTSASPGLSNAKQQKDCEIKLVRTDNTVTGTYCNGDLEGKFEYKNGQAIYSGQFKKKGGDPGKFLFVLINLESQQFTGSASRADGGGGKEWCGWRVGLTKPDPCLAK